MSKIIEVEAAVKVEISDEQYEELLKVNDGRIAHKFQTFKIPKDKLEVDVFFIDSSDLERAKSVQIYP